MLALFLAAVAAAITWQVLRVREPTYQGRRLSSWLQQYGTDGGSTQEEVDEAVRSIGTNAIPTLLRMLEANDTALKVKLSESGLLWRFGLRFTPAAILHAQALQAFRALGVDGSNAAPALVEIYGRNISPSSRRATGDSLVEIGPAAKQAIPVLIKSSAGTNAEERAYAAYTMGRLALEPALVVPVLTHALHDVDREVRYNAAFGLGGIAFMGGDARPAVPVLVETLKDDYGTARAAAAMALGHIHAEPSLVVPALSGALRDSSEFVRAQAAGALAEFGTNARPAAETLTSLLTDPNAAAREAATNALRRISPAAER